MFLPRVRGLYLREAPGDRGLPVRHGGEPHPPPPRPARGRGLRPKRGGGPGVPAVRDGGVGRLHHLRGPVRGLRRAPQRGLPAPPTGRQGPQPPLGDLHPSLGKLEAEPALQRNLQSQRKR